ncbi:MAG TPA: phosphoribosylformimino-5-aminoimidazole carboxamide ribotide isomerase [Candidatus Limnocylindria bacterium]|nr:phosphoribosylformimino-5-aminoimidazole carboxamide ribotide isomerase [Candidatus Limnocylindria bacterium]
MFRPCIDLRNGKVVQIVGGTLTDSADGLRTNFESSQPPAYFAELYRQDGLTGGHVIALGPGNEEAAKSALGAWPGGLQYGGGVNSANARQWLDAGASHVIATSWIFFGGQVDWQRLRDLVALIGRERLVLDLSCRKRDGRYWVVTDRWQKFTSVSLGREVLASLASQCAEFLVHAVDVEGLCRGIDNELVAQLAQESTLPVTYAGGARSLDDLETVETLGKGRVDLTIGSALDIFGGTGVRYAEAVEFNRTRRKTS